MLTKQRIERFYEDVEALGLKFPGAEISKATGYSKGNVSSYLSKALEPSEAFIDKFYEVFQDSIKKVPRETLLELKNRLTELEKVIKVGTQIQSASLEIVSLLASKDANVYSKVVGILKKYKLEGSHL